MLPFTAFMFVTAIEQNRPFRSYQLKVGLHHYRPLESSFARDWDALIGAAHLPNTPATKAPWSYMKTVSSTPSK
ncbi:hypothetical protein A0U94_05970 [Gluconobacter albidus]|nr:hypothetical protein A0U94_05970 [Gluconobacter albidus]